MKGDGGDFPRIKKLPPAAAVSKAKSGAQKRRQREDNLRLNDPDRLGRTRTLAADQVRLGAEITVNEFISRVLEMTVVERSISNTMNDLMHSEGREDRKCWRRLREYYSQPAPRDRNEARALLKRIYPGRRSSDDQHRGLWRDLRLLVGRARMVADRLAAQIDPTSGEPPLDLLPSPGIIERTNALRGPFRQEVLAAVVESLQGQRPEILLSRDQATQLGNLYAAFAVGWRYFETNFKTEDVSGLVRRGLTADPEI